MPRPTSTRRAAGARTRLSKTEKRRRDRAIVQLWRNGWTGKKIAIHLGVTPAIVANVVHARGERRRPHRRVIRTAGVADAPVVAWQQAMLPALEAAADDLGVAGAEKRAIVFLGLLRQKPYDDIEVFQSWVHQVTGFAPKEIAAFVARARENFLIIGDQPNHAAFDAMAADDESAAVEMIVLAEVLQGRFRRTADGKYALPETTA